jgi:hypothetical protein
MMDDDAAPGIQSCLAYAVLDEYKAWLGIPSPTCLQSFLSGAVTRANLVGQALPQWKVFGPLVEDEFCLALAARTGDPAQALLWTTILERHHFCLADTMRELRDLMRDWVERHGFNTADEAEPFHGENGVGLLEHLKHIARRPGMYFGQNSGWALRCYLAGMDQGGDWLGLRTHSGIRAIIDGIEAQSQETYGSKFGIYRVYEDSPSTILAFVGVEPE